MRIGSKLPAVSATAFIAVLLTFTFLASARSAEIPRAGGVLPSFELPGPAVEEDRQYLGIKQATFELKDVDCQLLIVEIIGVYCPYCYEQAPLFNKLYNRLKRKNLGDKVKMLAVAAGGTVPELEYLRNNGSYEFPVVRDESFAFHKLLGEPRTPFTLLIAGDGKILHTHQGITEDPDAFYKIIEDHLKTVSGGRE